jgi:hypothetical protein
MGLLLSDGSSPFYFFEPVFSGRKPGEKHLILFNDLAPVHFVQFNFSPF